MTRARAATTLAGLMALCALGGCGGDGETGTGDGDTATANAPATTAPESAAALPYDRLEEPRCDPGLANCAEARGEIAYVERVDPDGDGDAHFVLLSADGITGPGISVIDVEASLRPRPLPGPGDLMAAAGPVYTGSLGQKQIQATAIGFVRVEAGG